MADGNTMKRIRAGRYEDGTYGIRHVAGTLAGVDEWQTFELANETDMDGGWMQTYRTLRDAKAGVAELVARLARG
jgi:hypothetical protein